MKRKNVIILLPESVKLISRKSPITLYTKGFEGVFVPAFDHPMGEEILTVYNSSKPLYHKGFRDFEMIEFHGFRYYLTYYLK